MEAHHCCGACGLIWQDLTKHECAYCQSDRIIYCIDPLTVAVDVALQVLYAALLRPSHDADSMPASPATVSETN